MEDNIFNISKGNRGLFGCKVSVNPCQCDEESWFLLVLCERFFVLVAIGENLVALFQNKD